MQLLSGSCEWFWRVLGCTYIRCHWKHDIVDTFTHHFCANGHGWIIGTSFPYIRKSERRHSSPVQYTCISSRLSWLYFTLQALLQLEPFTRWETSLLCCATGYGPCHWDPCQCSSRRAQVLHFQITFMPTICRLSLRLHRFFISIYPQRCCVLSCTITSQICFIIVQYDLPSASCTIQSTTSMTLLGRCTSTFA